MTYQLQMSTCVISLYPDSTSSFCTAGTLRKPATSLADKSSQADTLDGEESDASVLDCDEAGGAIEGLSCGAFCVHANRASSVAADTTTCAVFWEFIGGAFK